MAPVMIDKGMDEVELARIIVVTNSPRRFLSLDSRVKSFRGFLDVFEYSLRSSCMNFLLVFGMAVDDHPMYLVRKV